MLAYDLDPCQLEAPARARMEQRTTPKAKSLIERAAHALGVTPSEFVTRAACREARETLNLCETTRIPAEAARAFVTAFEQEEPAPALVDLMRMHAKVTAARA